MSKKITWSTQQRKISDLIPFENNPRQLTDKQAKELKKSISKFDLAEIPAINTDQTILAGHMRLNIMRQLGRQEEVIDVRVPSRELTKEEASEYMLRSNKNTGEWDMDLLSTFDIDLLQDVGFKDSDLKLEVIREKIDPKDTEEAYHEKYAIIVDVENEQQQQELYSQLQEMGYTKLKILSI
jgi:hypothetical protein